MGPHWHNSPRVPFMVLLEDKGRLVCFDSVWLVVTACGTAYSIEKPHEMPKPHKTVHKNKQPIQTACV